MVIRGICCLIPQIPGITENIRVISIVGKFLEHARVFCFGSGRETALYISSADLMTRNTQRRIEIACPILDSNLKNRVLDMLDTMVRDNTNGWELFSDGEYFQRRKPEEGNAINSQEFFTQEARNKAPLSGSGKNGQKSSGRNPSIGAALRKVRQIFGK